MEVTSSLACRVALEEFTELAGDRTYFRASGYQIDAACQWSQAVNSHADRAALDVGAPLPERLLPPFPRGLAITLIGQRVNILYPMD